jgi:hypothetical protein
MQPLWGKNIRTTAQDARKDIELFNMTAKSGFPNINDAVRNV